MTSDPKFTHHAGVYFLEWQDEYLTVRVDRVRNSQWGVYGELLITTRQPRIQPHIHGPVQFNLTSTNARYTVAKHLLETINHVNWSAILEQTSYRVVEAHRIGTPAIHVAEHEMGKSLGMRVAPILQEKQPTVFFGEGDSLKSFFATFLSVLVQTGQVTAGLTPIPGNVLYLDYETDIDTFWDRVNLITAGLDIAIPDGLYYRSMVGSVVDEAPGVSKLISEKKIDLLVVDSAAPATIIPEDAKEVIPFFATLRSMDVTSLIIAHQTKTAKGEYPFGSSYFRNLPRANFLIKADRNSDTVAISVKHTKANNGRRLKPLGFEFTFTDTDVKITKAEAGRYPVLSRDLGPTERIKQMLADGELRTAIEITEELNDLDGVTATSQNTVNVTLNRGLKDGHLVSFSGKWGLQHQE